MLDKTHNLKELYDELIELIRALGGEHNLSVTLSHHQMLADNILDNMSHRFDAPTLAFLKSVQTCTDIAQYKKILASRYPILTLLPNNESGESAQHLKCVSPEKIRRVYRDAQYTKRSYEYLLIYVLNHHLNKHGDIALKIVDGKIEIYHTDLISPEHIQLRLKLHFMRLKANPEPIFDYSFELQKRDSGDYFQCSMPPIYILLTAYSLQLTPSEFLNAYCVDPPVRELDTLHERSFADRDSNLPVKIPVAKMRDLLLSSGLHSYYILAICDTHQLLEQAKVLLTKTQDDNTKKTINTVSAVVSTTLYTSKFKQELSTILSSTMGIALDVREKMARTCKILRNALPHLSNVSEQAASVSRILAELADFELFEKLGSFVGHCKVITDFDTLSIGTLTATVVQDFIPLLTPLKIQGATKQKLNSLDELNDSLERYSKLLKSQQLDQTSISRLTEALILAKDGFQATLKFGEKFSLEFVIPFALRFAKLCELLIPYLDVTSIIKILPIYQNATLFLIKTAHENKSHQLSEHYLNRLCETHRRYSKYMRNIDSKSISCIIHTIFVEINAARGNLQIALEYFDRLIEKFEIFYSEYLKLSPMDFKGNFEMLSSALNNLYIMAIKLIDLLIKEKQYNYALHFTQYFQNYIETNFINFSSKKGTQHKALPKNVSVLVTNIDKSLKSKLDEIRSFRLPAILQAFRECEFECTFDEKEQHMRIQPKPEQLNPLIRAFGDRGLPITFEQEKQVIFFNEFDQINPTDIKKIDSSVKNHIEKKRKAESETQVTATNDSYKNPHSNNNLNDYSMWSHLYQSATSQQRGKAKRIRLIPKNNPPTKQKRCIAHIAPKQLGSLSWGENFPKFDANNSACPVIALSNNHIVHGVYFAYMDTNKVPQELVDLFMPILARGNIVSTLNQSGIKFYKKNGENCFKIKKAGNNIFIMGRVVSMCESTPKDDQNSLPIKHYLICFDTPMNHQTENRPSTSKRF